MSTSTGRVAVVVGASSGIGRALLDEYLSRGFRVAGLARRGELLQEFEASHPGEGARIWTSAHDVRHCGEVPGLIAAIEEHFQAPIDTLVYAAGIMPETDAETWDLASDFETLDVNLRGALAWLHHLAPAMSARGAGHIVGISSIAGDRGRRDHLAYHVSKAALTTALESARNRVHRHGVRVTTIKPGYIATPMTEGHEGLFWVASAERAAREIATAGERGVPTRYVLRRWWIIGTIVKLIPSFVFRRLNF